MRKSSREKRWLAFVLCMTLVLSTNTVSMAAEKSGTEVQTVTEAPTESEAEAAEIPEISMETDQMEAEASQEWTQEVNGSIVKVTAAKGILPEEAVLSAEQITEVTEVEKLEKAAEEQAIQKKAAIENIVAYDIKFLVNGQEVQPNGKVQVTVDTSIIESGQEAAVLHVDDNNVAEDMQGAVDEQGNVVFETSHFSKYVIIQEGDSEVSIVVQHYNQQNNTKIYADDNLVLPVGGRVNDYAKAINWNVEKVLVDDKELSQKEYEEIKLAKDATIKIYYSPKKTEVSGAATFYDYTIKAGIDYYDKTKYSINMPENYSNGGGTSSDRMTAGVDSFNYEGYRSDAEHSKWYGGSYHEKAYTGLVSGLDENGDVIFSVPQPGFFENSDVTVSFRPARGSSLQLRNLRKVYKDYTLKFNQSGDMYTLDGVYDGSEKLANAGTGFFPLDKVKVRYGSGTDSDNDHNFYFGMRYDVNFKIGDYIGPLNYSFTGDDDLWAILDGKEVVIDLGGIHKALTDEVDLWNYILHEGYTEEEKADLSTTEKEQEHTLTILYMERGAEKSNCNMNFTLPSAKISEVTTVPMADLLLRKVNKDKDSLEGAAFSLKDSTGNTIQTAASTGDGSVKFSKLREGTYILEETKAPSGYIPSLETWVVKVKVVDETAVATLYLSDGETEYTNKSGSYYEIVNVTEQEMIDSVMKYDKTAKVECWEERTYNIDITAASTATQSITTKGAADIMLVLDLSGSMNYGNNASSHSYAEYQKVGPYSEVKDSLDTTKVYYYNKDCSMIYIEDQWQYYKEDRWNPVRSNSYKTIYTRSSRLTGVKEAMNSFVSSIAESSPNTKLGVVTFSSSGYTTHNQNLVPLEEVGENKTSIIKNISKVSAKGGTNPGDGLELANQALNRDEIKDDKLPKYVILFTDGEPTGGKTNGKWDEKAMVKTKLQSDLIKQENAILYTIGFGLTDRAEKWLSGENDEIADGMNTSGIASKNCAWTADNMDDLKELFKNLQDTITQTLEIKEAEIKDVIDPRFIILDDTGKPITKDYPGIENGIVLENGGKVYYDKKTGYQCIKWTNQTIPAKDKGSQWHKTIKVQAQEDYIGGNNVSTNISPDSQIHTGYGDAVLPKPEVNVKVDLTVGNAGERIFLGEYVPTDEKTLKQLFNEANYKKYTGVTADDFNLEWYRDSSCTKRIAIEDMGKEHPNTTTEFYLKVTYDAGTPTLESNLNTDNYINGTLDSEGKYPVTAVNSEDTSKLYGIYKIEVVSGEIAITKTMKETANINLEGAPIFTFKIEYTKPGDESVTKTYYRTIRFEEGQQELNAEPLKNLPKGTYQVTELNTQKYELESVEDNGSNCDFKSTEKSITFILGGFHPDERANTNWTQGKAKFVNKKEAPNTNTDTDVYVNRFVRNDDGTYTVQQIRIPKEEQLPESKRKE